MKAEGRNFRRRGAALVVAMAVAAVVLLSTMLLLGYIQGMVSDQTESELGAQANLSQQAAVLEVASEMEGGDAAPGGPIESRRLAGMTTSFTVEQTGTSGPRRLDLDLTSQGLRELLASGGFLAAYSRDGKLVLDHLTAAGERTSGFPLALGPMPDAWDIAGFPDGEYLAAVVRGTGDGAIVTLVAADGSMTTLEGELPLWRAGGNVSAGTYGGEPAVVATNGRNWGHLLLPESGRVLYFWSKPGTSPVVTADGGLFGSLSTQGVSGLPGPEITDSYSCDADGDGQEDQVWVSGDGVSCYLAGRDVLAEDYIRGGTPLAWGELEPWSGLSVLWRDGSGESRWRRLSWEGFVDSQLGGAVFDQPWRGRITSGDGVVFGSADGSWIIFDAEGAVTDICDSDGSFFGDFDGTMGPEVARTESGGLRAWMNPTSGAGSTVLVEAATTDGRGRLQSRGSWLYSIYESRDGRREVYVEKAR